MTAVLPDQKELGNLERGGTIVGESMLIDILGVLVGFATVMLLLSLIVTSLSQFTQATLRLRG